MRKYLFYDKCAGGPTGLYDHSYDNEYTMRITIDDLTDDDDYVFFNKENAFDRYDSKFRGIFQLEKEIFTSSEELFSFGLYEKNIEDMHLMFAVIGINVDKLEHFISSGQQIPYVDFLCGLCEYHLNYTITGDSCDDDVDYMNRGIMLGNVYFCSGAGRFKLFYNDNLLNLMNENGRLKDLINSQNGIIQQLQKNLYDESEKRLYNDKHDKKIVTLMKLGKPIISNLTNMIDGQYDLAINDVNDTITKLESAYNDLLSLQPKINLDDKMPNILNTLKSKIDYYHEQLKL